MYRSLHDVTYYFYPLLEDALPDSPIAASFNATWAEARRSSKPALLYVHIPFCHDLCRFCPFHVRVNNDAEAYAAYARSLCREIALTAETRYVNRMPFQAIYFGGGSPSILGVENIRMVFDALFRHFNIADDAEISFEGEPRTLSDPALLDLLKERGVSRVSFGLQTFDTTMRERFNIVATLDDVERCTRNARERGFADINVDMMYDLPGQTVSEVERDMRMIRDWGYDSVDYYNLHYFAFPKKFKEAMQSGEIPPKPGPDMHFALTEQIRHRMREYGYRNVADQIYSRHDQVCEYFRLLWGGGGDGESAETIALGSSARGYINGVSYMNYGNVHRYQESIDSGVLPVEKLSRRLANPANRTAAFMVKLLSLPKSQEAARATIVPEVWQGWIDDGLVYETETHWHLSERGKSWSTNMMLDTFEPHQRQLAEGSAVKLVAKPGVRTGTF
jgi:coproporphyrinogen III oxidase-like Fe-S oxidoreductase